MVWTGQNENQVHVAFYDSEAKGVGLFSGTAVGNHKGPMKLQACLYSAGGDDDDDGDWDRPTDH